ncbi:flavodoxin domain-containing protein [Candidatus Galacturonibacter soehngenii]|uniref:Flavodoxin domain-containing protein n=1 Tax=Candidatus Galacturonatibacter soehngenii TaxID=2307010 RepID=A0A7V7UBD3_9FIRM|nr:flavodoxin domain-containing protein [Candidatus Galacturonibacter soehngenii]KAB1437449.1 hypothetical protein F7O84_07505 [Candidatus Galacturonibacter soehngenii]
MKKIVIYSSKTGFTKQYANWIAKELNCEAISLHEVTKESLKPYHTVIYGGGITAGQIGGLKKFKNIMLEHSDKQIFVFATGATPMENKENLKGIINANFTQEEKVRIPFYYFQSGINYENMKLGGKMVLRILAVMLEKKKNKTKDEIDLIQALRKSNDCSNISHIIPLVDKVRRESNEKTSAS